MSLSTAAVAPVYHRPVRTLGLTPVAEPLSRPTRLTLWPWSPPTSASSFDVRRARARFLSPATLSTPPVGVVSLPSNPENARPVEPYPYWAPSTENGTGAGWLWLFIKLASASSSAKVSPSPCATIGWVWKPSSMYALNETSIDCPVMGTIWFHHTAFPVSFSVAEFRSSLFPLTSGSVGRVVAVPMSNELVARQQGA